MHDHSLGPEYDVGIQLDANHSGSCTDGVYGCSRCWNAANDGQGTEDECDRCGQTAFTRITRAHDEPVSYAWCKECREVIARIDAEGESLQAHEDYLGHSISDPEVCAGGCGARVEYDGDRCSMCAEAGDAHG